MMGRRRLIAALLALLPLFGCGARPGREAQPSEPPAQAAPGQQAKAGAPPEPSSAAGQEQAAPSSMQEGSEGCYRPGKVERVQDEGYVLRFSPAQSINFIELPEGRQAAGAAVFCGGREIYRALPDSDSRLLRFDTVQAERLEVRLPAPLEGEDPRAGLLPGETACAAYLPAATDPAALEGYAASLERLSRVIVITGLFWEESGQVVVADENYPALIERLRALREEHGFSLCSTLYPARALIREKRAGAAAEAHRQALVASICAHAQAYGLDGIDIDWETPLDEAEWAACSGLLEDLKQALSREGRTLSAALYPESLEKLSPGARAALDALHLMSYDQFDALGRHATFGGLEREVARALEAGFLPEQLSAGIPAYGRPLDGAARWPLYCEQALPLAGETTGAGYFNDPVLVRDKAAFCRQKGLSGVFFFHLTGDLPADAPYSLLGAVD